MTLLTQLARHPNVHIGLYTRSFQGCWQINTRFLVGLYTIPSHDMFSSNHQVWVRIRPCTALHFTRHYALPLDHRSSRPCAVNHVPILCLQTDCTALYFTLWVTDRSTLCIRVDTSQCVPPTHCIELGNINILSRYQIIRREKLQNVNLKCTTTTKIFKFCNKK